MNKGTTTFFVLISVLVGTWAAFMLRSLLDLGTLGICSLGLGVTGVAFMGCRYSMMMVLRGWDSFNNSMEQTSIEVLLSSVVGGLLGMAIGFVLGNPFKELPGGGEYVSFLAFFLCGFLGLTIGRRKAYDLVGLFQSKTKDQTVSIFSSNDKVLDTSAIIDGRIYDVALSGFLEGRLVVPGFVIEELRHIADSSDFIRRSKGRRGLEILSKMQKHPAIPIGLFEGDFPEEREVDMKLLHLCKDIDASIVTNDYNLNKVAELQGIKVLNVNELTNAVKVIVFPGETMRISVIKEGKEDGQGVGYLDDGTMVVVESGDKDIGQDIEVVVTSVFQTAAGRMIFTKKTREAAKLGGTVQKLQEVNLFG